MRNARRVVVAGVTAGVMAMALAGCGSESAPGTHVRTATSSPAPVPDRAEALARHDRLFPQVAARCAGIAATPAPSTNAADPTGDGGTWADKYAENHGFKQTAPLLADAACRGEAHAARITDALQRSGTSATLSEADLRAVLEGLGYPTRNTNVHPSDAVPGFALEIPEVGPCISGLLTSPHAVRPHGMYLDGGCVEPKGGH
ncbi:hypothetical protein [Kitasatospora sp. NPDC087314]|uniref:hypothetical protein n=1 Tax=Kitasatospora sp. NPDC087314 TaxID=3364068 RepID=UPI00381CD90D